MTHGLNWALFSGCVVELGGAAGSGGFSGSGCVVVGQAREWALQGLPKKVWLDKSASESIKEKWKAALGAHGPGQFCFLEGSCLSPAAGSFLISPSKVEHFRVKFGVIVNVRISGRPTCSLWRTSRIFIAKSV